MHPLLAQKNRSIRRARIIQHATKNRDLPVLPKIVQRLETLLLDPDVHAQRVVKLIESEPVVAGRVLSLANSAFYGAGRQYVENIGLAVGRLGFSTIRTLTYAAVLPTLFVVDTSFDHKQFWTHSLISAHLAREIVTRQFNDRPPPQIMDVAYLAGLMHDLGVLLFVIGFADEYGEIVRRGFESGLPVEEAERLAFGIDHAELGATFLDRNWKLEDRLAKAVSLHHTSPSEYAPSRNHVVVRGTIHFEAVYVANLICNVYGIRNGLGNERWEANLSSLVTLARLGYEEEMVDELVEVARSARDEVMAMLDMSEGI